jgi:serine phosphatase RsbU (regulator of sigma subunit)
MVANRTQELENALDEVQIQNEVIAIQKNEVVRQKNEMAYANKVITSSIEYAKHIQLAMLPNTDAWQRFKDKHFVLYMPQHIVSGDFYWIKTTGKHTYVAVADCTGHGVPGAFMSVMGISFINQIISSNCTLDTATILNIIRFKIKESLRQSNEYNTSRDGMDMSLCKIHHSNLSVEFSGANSNMYISRKDAHDQEVEVIKGEKMPVGVHLVEEPFTSQRVQLTAGDVFYLSSDGFADQVNDHNGKKLMSKKYRELLSSLSSLPMNERGEKLKSEFLAWKGSADQVDDVTVVGIQL